jgi:hypothetical protein
VLICTFEDRATDIIGLKLLICGLSRYMPDVPVRVTCPVADDEFRSWLQAHPQVTLTDDPQLRGMGWNVKPILLAQLLQEGHDTVIWMDSDIIVTRDFRDHLPAGDALVVAHEPALTPYAVRQRVAGWQLQPGRTLLGVNTCVVRAKPTHARLLAAWQSSLQDPVYRAAQQASFAARPPHLIGDQDVLLALLSSQQFAEVPVHILKCGPSIIQQSGIPGYPPIQRLMHLLRGMPPLVHSQSFKPWRFPTVPSPRRALRAYLTSLYLETSPYTYSARRSRAESPGLPPCLEVRTLPGRLSRLLSFGQPSLGGITQATLATSWKRIRQLTGLMSRAPRKLQRLVIARAARYSR